MPEYVAAGAPLDDADAFDASFFGYARREAEIMDPQHRVFLECAWAALEDAGYDPSTYPGRIGIFGGVGPNTYRQQVLERRRDILDLMGRYPLLIGSEREYAITRDRVQARPQGPCDQRQHRLLNVRGGASPSLPERSEWGMRHGPRRRSQDRRPAHGRLRL